MLASRNYEQYVQELAGQIGGYPEFQDARFVVAGASGMIGSVLVDCLMEASRKWNWKLHVTALGRSETALEAAFGVYWEDKRFEAIACDINKELPELGDADYIIHGASNTHPRAYSKDPIGTILTNVMGTEHLLEYARKCHARRFAFLSSVEIYGTSAEGRFREDSGGYIDCNTLRAGYPEGKRVGESLCCAYKQQYDVDFVIPRLCRIYGPTMKPEDSKALSQFIKKAVEGEDIVLKSSGQQFYSYLNVMDAIAAILLILHAGKTGEAYNVSSELSDITLKDLAGKLAAMAGKTVVYGEPEEEERRGYSAAVNAVLDNRKLKDLGWKERFDIDSGLQMTVDILKELRSHKDERHGRKGGIL